MTLTDSWPLLLVPRVDRQAHKLEPCNMRFSKIIPRSSSATLVVVPANSSDTTIREPFKNTTKSMGMPIIVVEADYVQQITDKSSNGCSSCGACEPTYGAEVGV